MQTAVVQQTQSAALEVWRGVSEREIQWQLL